MINESLEFIVFFAFFLFFTFFQKTLTKITKKVICPICFATTTTWMTLGCLYLFPSFNFLHVSVDPLFLSILMGGSAVGISSLLDQYHWERSKIKAIVKGIIISLGFSLVYLSLYYHSQLLFLIMMYTWFIAYTMMTTISLSTENQTNVGKSVSLEENQPEIKIDPKAENETPRAYARGILCFFGGVEILRSRFLAFLHELTFMVFCVGG